MRAMVLPQEHSRIRTVIEFLGWSAFIYLFGIRGSKWGFVPLVGLASFWLVEGAYAIRNMTAARARAEVKDRSVIAIGGLFIVVCAWLLRYVVVRGL